METTTTYVSVKEMIVVRLRSMEEHWDLGNYYDHYLEFEPAKDVKYGEILAMRPGQAMICWDPEKKHDESCGDWRIVESLPHERVIRKHCDKKARKARWNYAAEQSFWDEDVMIRTKRGVKVIHYHYASRHNKLSREEVVNVILK